MAYNYPTQNFQTPGPQHQNQNNTTFQQNVQPLFPQPQGNVYTINSTLEVANVPVGAGVSVALCLNEGFMYIKTMQNGNPLFWAYKITPYDSTKPAEEEKPTMQPDNFEERFSNIEKQIKEIKKTIKDKGEWEV